MTTIEVPPTISPRTTLLAGKRVLVVDDDGDALELLEDLIKHAGALVMVARNADEALRKLDERPDIIVSDISMPDGDGYQLIRRIRARSPERGGSTPAIALTGRATATDHTRAMLAGFQLHLGKPTNAKELVDSIHQLLDRRSASH